MTFACPEHGETGCPIAFEDDPPGAETCAAVAAYIEGQIGEAKAGNYTRTWKDDAGVRWRQEYRHHTPVGESRAWRPSARDT
jgi:hypothetical protein